MSDENLNQPAQPAPKPEFQLSDCKFVNYRGQTYLVGGKYLHPREAQKLNLARFIESIQEKHKHSK